MSAQNTTLGDDAQSAKDVGAICTRLYGYGCLLQNSDAVTFHMIFHAAYFVITGTSTLIRYRSNLRNERRVSQVGAVSVATQVTHHAKVNT